MTLLYAFIAVVFGVQAAALTITWFWDRATENRHKQGPAHIRRNHKGTP